jgi:hopanoid C-2 methylase
VQYRGTSYAPKNSRRILCVFPRYTPSFGTLHHAYPLTGRARAFMPPQGILTVAAYMPDDWSVRFVDENMRPAEGADYRWADAVLVSGMHIQRPQIRRINEQAHEHGKITVVGGPSVSGCPAYYPDFDVLHVGELGDATDRLIAHLDTTVERPTAQLRFETDERLPLEDFPSPAYDQVRLDRYFLASIQFSSGCPYSCEFCDIPELYGRRPRLKSPEQVLTELDTMLESGNPGAVYFVDDNFIGNPKATAALLPHLIAWQEENGYPVQFACEATLNIAQRPELLELMREAYFCTVFCGIETPAPEALRAISKEQNLRMPMLEAVKVLNGYGMEVVSGMIIGFDTDTPDTADGILDFIRESHVPMLTINLLYALPRTPLWRRLESDGRILDDPGRESNVDFLLPYEQVLGMWHRCIREAYEPEFLFERFAYQCEHTFPNRLPMPNGTARASWSNLKMGLWVLANLVVRAGVFGSYRRTFWRFAGPLLKTGRIEPLLHAGLVSHHLIEFTQECLDGRESASFFSQRQGQAPAEPAGLPT